MLNPTATTDTADVSEVCLTGSFRSVDWNTGTAQFHQSDGTVTTVSFTPEQDGWLKLVANVPVNLKGILGLVASDSSGNGSRADDSVCTDEQDVLQLIEVKVVERGWFPYTLEDAESVRARNGYDPEKHEPLSFDFYDDAFMRDIRGPDYGDAGA